MSATALMCDDLAKINPIDHQTDKFMQMFSRLPATASTCNKLIETARRRPATFSNQLNRFGGRVQRTIFVENFIVIIVVLTIICAPTDRVFDFQLN